MMILVDDKIYDGAKELIMIALTDRDKQNIANMLPECNVYAKFPDSVDLNVVLETMKYFKVKAGSKNPRPRRKGKSRKLRVVKSKKRKMAEMAMTISANVMYLVCAMKQDKKYFRIGWDTMEMARTLGKLIREK